MKLTVVIPAKDEPPDWVQDVVDVSHAEADEVLVVSPDAMTITDATLIPDVGRTKASALNQGLAAAQGDYVVFVDADVKLAPGQLSTVRDMLASGMEFVGAGYGYRRPPFMLMPPTSGWFFAANRDVFRNLGGWKEHPVEDVYTIRGLQRSGHRVWMAPFVVELRRAPRNAWIKIGSAIFIRP